MHFYCSSAVRVPSEYETVAALSARLFPQPTARVLAEIPLPGWNFLSQTVMTFGLVVIGSTYGGDVATTSDVCELVGSEAASGFVVRSATRVDVRVSVGQGGGWRGG